MENEQPVLKTSEPTAGWKIVKTIFLILVWICLGLYLEITGPTLIDLKLRTHSDYEAIATAVSGRSIGSFIGCVLGGVLVDKFGIYCDLFVALCLDGAAIFTVAVPWVSVTDLLFVMTLGQGLFEGITGIVGQKLILNMWKEKAASPLHVLHGGYGIGSFIIPLIANPFLAEIVKADDNSTSADNEFSPTTEGAIEYKKESRIEYAYIVVAAVIAAVSLVFYGYHFTGYKERQMSRRHVFNTGVTQEESEDTANDAPLKLSFKQMFNPATCAVGNFCYSVQIFVLLFLFYIQVVGGQMVGGKFIRSFSIDHFNFSNDDASYINTLFWIAFSVGRLSGFLPARWIPMRILIIIETGGALVASILMVIFGGESKMALWALMPIVGFFNAPLYPSGLGWANFHVEMTGVGLTIIMLGGSVGGVIYMKLIGFLYEYYGTRMFLYTLLGYGIAAFALAVLMDIAGAQHGNRFKNKKDNKEKEVDIVVTEQNTKF